MFDLEQLWDGWLSEKISESMWMRIKHTKKSYASFQRRVKWSVVVCKSSKNLQWAMLHSTTKLHHIWKLK